MILSEVKVYCRSLSITISEKRCHIPKINNATIDAPNRLFLIGAKITVYCTINFKRFVAQCISNNNGEAVWNSTFDICSYPLSPNLTCSPPLVGKNVAFNPSKTSYNLTEVVQFSCSKGKLIGPPQSRCVVQDFTDRFTNITTQIAAFYGSPPICSVERCAAIKSLNNMLANILPPVDGEIFEEGTIVTFSCTEGYLFVCNRSDNCAIKCVENNKWNISSSTELPRCMPNECIVEGNEELQPLRTRVPVGEPVLFTCAQPNYILSGKFLVLSIQVV